jgi:hypothetical protein
MEFKKAIICLFLSASTANAFAPSRNQPTFAISTKLHSSTTVSAEDINVKLAIQMKKLREKDSTSTSLSADVSESYFLTFR